MGLRHQRSHMEITGDTEKPPSPCPPRDPSESRIFSTLRLHRCARPRLLCLGLVRNPRQPVRWDVEGVARLAETLPRIIQQIDPDRGSWVRTVLIARQQHGPARTQPQSGFLELAQIIAP